MAAVRFVIDILEGGAKFTNNPADRGGPTKYGISQKAHPDIDVANLTRDEAIRLYHERYWVACRADLFPGGLALQWFAAYVNMSPRSAVKCLQRALSRGLTVDGILGPKTLSAVRHYRNQSELRASLSRACIEHHLQDVRERPPQVVFLPGWIQRICRVADEAGAWGDSE